jgi:ElaB/YqjD/DUF883 family membrane-anchored ribosome-binding protein
MQAGGMPLASVFRSSTASDPFSKGRYFMAEQTTSEQEMAEPMAGDTQKLQEHAGKAKEAIKNVAHEAGRYASRHMADMKDTASQWAHTAKDQANTLGEVIDDYVQQHPYKSLAIAAGAGLLLGMLLKRR